MKFHKQKLLYTPDTYPDGSCYPTCYACILDMELEEVPYFNLFYFTSSKQKANLDYYMKEHYNNPEYSEEVNKHNREVFENDKDWLWENARKYWLISMGYTEDYIADHEKWLKENPDREYLASGDSPRTSHVVVYKNGKLLHDPHPSNAGLVKINNYSYLRKIEGDYEFDRYYLKLNK
jgi:hypothetical protein